jgi:cytochrome c peroxidase
MVIDADGTRRRLFDYLGDKQVLLSFVYTTCSDGRGCPLATAVLHMIHRRLSTDGQLAENVRLVSLSFDPEHDTPRVMRQYVPGQQDYFDTPWQKRPWVFLTTRSRSELEGILDGYGQYVVRERDEAGQLTGRYTHVLKVFLIDRSRQVRNIYSSSFLHPALAINDLETLLIEEAGAV